MNNTSIYTLNPLQWRGTFLVALSGALFGSMGFLGTKLFYLHFTVENMLFWRFFIATVWISIHIILFNSERSIFSLQPLSVLKIFLLGTLSYSSASAFYFLASQHIGTGLAMVIFFSFPVIVALFSWVWGDWKLTKTAFFALVTVLLGLILLKGRGNSTLDGIGIIMAGIAACCFAAYVYGNQHTTKNMDARQLTLLVCLGNTVLFFCLSCYNHRFILPSTWTAWLYIIAIGIIATALPIQLLLNGLKYISPVKASILSVLEPVITLLLGLTLLGETVSAIQFLGVVIILLGAILIQFEKTF
jgi:drug/metabolite transporter (DMT)-like permease